MIKFVTFRIAPETYTERLRDAFVDNDFGAAYRLFEELFPDADVKWLIGVLKCEKQVVMDENGYLSFGDDSPENNPEYMEDMTFRYGCLWRDGDGRLLRPTAVLDGFANLEWSKAIQKALDGDELVKDGEMRFAFEETDVKELPFWMRPHEKPSDAVAAYGRHFTLPRKSFDDFKGMVRQEDWREAIFYQAERFIPLKYDWHGEKTISVPEAPFRLWCMGRDVALVRDRFPWKPVVPKDAKMSMDSQVHSDWLAGAGLNLESWYVRAHDENDEYNAIDKAAWDEAFRYALEVKRELGLLDEPHAGLVEPGR